MSTATQIPFVEYLRLEPTPHLVANECTSCGARYFDRRNACAACFATDFTPVDIDTLPHQRWAEETEEKLKLTRAMMPSGDAFDRYNTESFREGLLELRNAIAEAERFGVDALAYNQHGALADTAAYKL